MGYRLTTIRGHSLFEVSSALQKAIRRADARLAGYFAIELFESNYRQYVWRRLLTISAEDCWGAITFEIEALYRAWKAIDVHQPGRGRVFVAKAAILLAQAKKCRDADHLTNLVYDPKSVSDEAIEALIEESRRSPEPIILPDYTFDVHTSKGRKLGKTKADFFREEHAALQPRQLGLFDSDVESLTETPRTIGAASKPHRHAYIEGEERETLPAVKIKQPPAATGARNFISP